VAAGGRKKECSFLKKRTKKLCLLKRFHIHRRAQSTVVPTNYAGQNYDEAKKFFMFVFKKGNIAFF